MYSFIPCFLWIYDQEGLQDHMVAFTCLFVFKGISILFSKVAEPIYIPTNSTEGFPSLHTLSTIYSLLTILLVSIRSPVKNSSHSLCWWFLFFLIMQNRGFIHFVYLKRISFWFCQFISFFFLLCVCGWFLFSRLFFLPVSIWSLLSSSFSRFFIFYFGHATWLAASYFSYQGLNLHTSSESKDF